MDFYALLIIALALSMDAFGVALSIGLNSAVEIKMKIFLAGSFGFFQFFFALIGALAGLAFTAYVAALPSIAGGVLIAIVGVMMFKEGMGKKEEKNIFKPVMILILGISVSIDALVIGFTVLNGIYAVGIIFSSALFIGIVSLLMSAAAFWLAKHLINIELVGRYADYIGGVILILFGMKMIFV